MRMTIQANGFAMTGALRGYTEQRLATEQQQLIAFHGGIEREEMEGSDRRVAGRREILAVER